MATSLYTSWELNRNKLIEAAYRKLGIPGEGNTLTTTQYTDGLEALNAVISLAVTDGMPLWKRTTLAVVPSTTSQVYTIPNAVKISSVFLRDTGGVQYELKNKSLYDFNRLPRNAIGLPVHWTWQPALEGGTVSIWPLTSDSVSVSTKTIQIIYQKEFDGFDDTTTDTPDFPAYWTTALIYKTSMLLAPEYGVPLEDRKMLLAEGNNYWKQASDYGDEDGSFFVQPERTW
jgi:hypothetical protein